MRTLTENKSKTLIPRIISLLARTAGITLLTTTPAKAFPQPPEFYYGNQVLNITGLQDYTNVSIIARYNGTDIPAVTTGLLPDGSGSIEIPTDDNETPELEGVPNGSTYQLIAVHEGRRMPLSEHPTNPTTFIQESGKPNPGSTLYGTATTPTSTPQSGLETLLTLQGPNPFIHETKLALKLTQPHHVRIDVYDTKGRMIDTLVNGMLEGETTVSWDGKDRNGSNVASGLYVLTSTTLHNGVPQTLTHKVTKIQ